MTSFFKPLLIAAVLAGAGMTANAQPGSGPQSGPMGQHQRMDPARMQEMMARRQADLKAQLKITAAQEAAWNAYIASLQPDGGKGAGKRMDPEARKQKHAEMAALTTPQRLDRMSAMHAERSAAMAQRQEATRTLYAALTPEQQQVFDARAMQRGRHGGGQGKHGAHRG